MITARLRKRDGRRVYEVRLRDPEGREYSRTFATKKAAQDYEADDRIARRRGSWVDPRFGDLTFEEVARRWLEANPAKRPSARAADESILRAHLGAGVRNPPHCLGHPARDSRRRQRVLRLGCAEICPPQV